MPSTDGRQITYSKRRPLAYGKPREFDFEGVFCAHNEQDAANKARSPDISDGSASSHVRKRDAVSILSVESESADEALLSQETPRAKRARRAVKLPMHLRKTEAEAEPHVTTPEPTTPPRTLSPGILDMHSLGIGTPRRLVTPKSRARVADSGTVKPVKTVKAIDFEGIYVDLTDSALEPYDFPLRTPKRRKRLIDTLAKEVDQSPHRVRADSKVSQQTPVRLEPEPERVRIAPLSFEPKITYASQRTYVAEELDITQPLFGPSLLPQFQDLLEHGQVTASPHAPAQSIRSIHDLRQAGVNKRSLDEIESLLEDVEDNGSSMSRRRTGAMTLAAKYADKAFFQQFIEHSFDTRLASALAVRRDVIADTALCWAAAALHQAGAVGFASEEALAGFAAGAASLVSDPRSLKAIAQQRSSNLSKFAKDQVNEFLSAVKKYDLWQYGDCALTPQLTGLVACSAIAKRPDGFRALAAQPGLMPCLVEPLSAARTRFVSEIPTVLTVFELSLSILTLFAIHNPSLLGDRPNGLHRTLVDLLPLSLSWSFTDAARLRILLIQFYLNVTHENPLACEQLARPALISRLIFYLHATFQELDGEMSEQDRDTTVQTLVAILCLLINLAESSSESRMIVFMEKEPHSGLDALLRIFIERQKDISEAYSIEKSKMSVVLGYISVFLAVLSETPEICIEVRSRLPDEKLAPLIDTLTQFTLVHQRVDEDLDKSGKTHRDGQVERMLAAIERLRGDGLM